MPPGQPFVGEGGAGVGSRDGLGGGVPGGWRLLRHSVYCVVASLASMASIASIESIASVASLASIGSIASERL